MGQREGNISRCALTADCHVTCCRNNNSTTFTLCLFVAVCLCAALHCVCVCVSHRSCLLLRQQLACLVHPAGLSPTAAVGSKCGQQSQKYVECLCGCVGTTDEHTSTTITQPLLCVGSRPTLLPCHPVHAYTPSPPLCLSLSPCVSLHSPCQHLTVSLFRTSIHPNKQTTRCGRVSGVIVRG